MTAEQRKEFDDLFYETGCKFGDQLTREQFDKEIVGGQEYNLLIEMMQATHNAAVRKCADSATVNNETKSVDKDSILQNLIP